MKKQNQGSYKISLSILRPWWRGVLDVKDVIPRRTVRNLSPPYVIASLAANVHMLPQLRRAAAHSCCSPRRFTAAYHYQLSSFSPRNVLPPLLVTGLIFLAITNHRSPLLYCSETKHVMRVDHLDSRTIWQVAAARVVMRGRKHAMIGFGWSVGHLNMISNDHYKLTWGYDRNR